MKNLNLKNLSLLALVCTFASSHAFAGGNLSYQCKVSRWDSSRGVGRICGDIQLSINDASEYDLKDCGVVVFGGSASSTKGRVLNVVVGTRASKLSGKDLLDMNSVSFYPESAPKDFETSLYPGSSKYGKYSIDMECVKIDILR